MKQHVMGSTFGKLVGFFGASATAGALAAGMLIPGAAMVGALSNGSKAVFDSLPSELAIEPLAQQSHMYALDGTKIATFFSENRVPVNSELISPLMKNAIISIEDARFYEHGGFDLAGITRAAVNNLRSSRTQGASTITQQYVKNMLKEAALAKDDTEGAAKAEEVSIGRKAREARLAVSLEKKMSKDEILTGYLNIAYFGAQAYGIEAAAKTYFSKGAAELTLPEAALLAGAVQNPTQFNAIQNPESAVARRNQVLENMLKYEKISQADYDAAVATPLAINYNPPQRGCMAATTAQFFCEYVTNTIVNNPAYGETPDDRRRLLNRGGLTINTTIDLRLQQAAEEAVVQLTPPGDPSGVVSGLVTVEPGTGKVLAMAQSRNYDTRAEPDPGTTSINYLVDKAEGGGTGFQTGSTYKTFVLAEWLKQGKKLYDTVPAEKKKWPASAWKYSCEITGNNGTDDGWEPDNSDGVSGGTMTILDGTVFSTNTVFTQMASQLDLCAIRDTAMSMGMHRADGEPLNFAASSILGTNEVAPMTVAAAYATFASGGIFCRPVPLSAMTGLNGVQYPVPEAGCQAVLDKDIAAGVNKALVDDARRGTAHGANAGGAVVAGKTGTSDNSAQTWLAGYTAGLSTISWVGNPDSPNASMTNLVIGGRQYGNVFAENIATPNWSNYMSKIGTLYNGSAFPEPSPNVLGDTKNQSNSPIMTNKLR